MEKPSIAIIGVKGIPAFGGSARAGENMLEFLKHKYNFTVYNISSHTERVSGFYDGFEQIVFKKSGFSKLNTFLYYVKATFHCLFYRRFDLIHVFHIDAAIIIPALRIKYKVVAGHRARPQDSSKWNRAEKQFFNLMEFIFYKLPADIIVSNSLPVIQDYQHKTKKKIQYIPNGVVISPFLTTLPTIEYKDYILFSAARLMETKGCHLMLEALNMINYRGLVIILGSFEHSPNYIDHLHELSNDLNVQYLGLIKDKAQLFSYIANAKFAVFPTYLEAMSNTLLEFALLKTPVICSDIPENTLVLNNNESIHFRSRSVPDLASKITWALENPSNLKSIAERAYQKVFTTYNWENLAQSYEMLYDSLIKP